MSDGNEREREQCASKWQFVQPSMMVILTTLKIVAFVSVTQGGYLCQNA